ncbi:MAG: hypothetical protein LPK88_04245 [Alphaproteobacteria bacterium]|nr:hypothetical protein [Alphaproteobacteria bacterium]MDX5415512.1 hypothetical protein [Alphaproteobacteria bacterium]MDX5492748.1 hypothetical protein [Alphaproteobacteria bacterium]
MASGVRCSKTSAGGSRPLRRTVAWTSFNKVATIARGTASVAFDCNGEHTRIRQVTASQTTLYITDPATGVSLEKVTGSGGSIQRSIRVQGARHCGGETGSSPLL